MVILSDLPTANRIHLINSTTEKDLNEKYIEESPHRIIMESPSSTPPKTSIDTSFNGVDPSAEFIGDVDTNNDIPSQEVLRKVESMIVLDKDGKTRPFKSLYSGPNVARRVLVIFIRHFFCGVSFLLARYLVIAICTSLTFVFSTRTAKNTSERSPHPSPKIPCSNSIHPPSSPSSDAEVPP